MAKRKLAEAEAAAAEVAAAVASASDSEEDDLQTEGFDFAALQPLAYIMSKFFESKSIDCTNKKGEAYRQLLLNWLGFDCTGAKIVMSAFGKLNIQLAEAYIK